MHSWYQYIHDVIILLSDCGKMWMVAKPWVQRIYLWLGKRLGKIRGKGNLGPHRGKSEKKCKA